MLPRRQLALLLAGVLLWWSAGFAASRAWERRQPPYIRALVEQVHFGNEAAIAEALPPGDPRGRGARPDRAPDEENSATRLAVLSVLPSRAMPLREKNVIAVLPA